LGPFLLQVIAYFYTINVNMKTSRTLPYAIFIVTLFCLFTAGNFCVAQISVRPLKELTLDTSGWASFKDATSDARNKFEILPVDPAKAKEALYQTQVTTHSVMGAIIYFTGGILIDGGWIRVLGSGSSKLDRSLPQWNKGKTYDKFGEEPKFLLIADDVIGGFYAINGGTLGDEVGKIYYLAPDDLHWEAMHIGYGEFINFCLNGDLDKFYTGFRWTNWVNDLTKINGSSALYIYPHLWTGEGKEINSDTRNIVAVQDLYDYEIGELNKLPK